MMVWLSATPSSAATWHEWTAGHAARLFEGR